MERGPGIMMPDNCFRKLFRSFTTIFLPIFWIVFQPGHASVVCERSSLFETSGRAAIQAEPDYQLKVVYVIASDREPHSEYAERLDYFLKKLRGFYAREMKSAGFVDAQGNGLTFQLETDTQGKVIVHLIDHRPGGNFPNAAKTAESYRYAAAAWEFEVADLFPAGFRDNSVVFAITECTDVNSEHRMSYGWHHGGGVSGPGYDGMLSVSDHIFGNDITYAMDSPPLIFHTMGRNDAEQLAILRDARFTNLIDPSRVYHRPAPDSWLPGEVASADNLRAWEWASIYLGVVAHELGHAFGLKHCFRFTPGRIGHYPGDYNTMGNGFRGFYQALFPDVEFTAAELYPRLAAPPANFGEAQAILHPAQSLPLSRNQFFSDGAWDADRVPPVIEHARAFFDPISRNVTIQSTLRDDSAPAVSGMSHVAYMLDWNIHSTFPINGPQDASIAYRMDTLEWNDLERAVPMHLFYQMGRGVHRVIIEAMDYAGNTADFKTSQVWFGVDEHYIEHWYVWSHLYDAWAQFGNAPFEDQMRHAWHGVPDGALQPSQPPVGTTGARWQYFHAGPYLDFVNAKKKYFNDPLDYSVRRVAYAGTKLHSNRERALRLRIGYNDFVHVFLNGQEIYIHPNFAVDWDPFDQSKWADVNVTLEEGENRLLVKHYNHIHEGGFMVWFHEENGDAVPIEIYPPANPATLSVIVPETGGFAIR